MNPGFVGTCRVASQTELQALLATHAGNEGWYFLRWVHKVSGFQRTLPEGFEWAAEGQMFTSDRELRWKPQGQEFSILLLSRSDAQDLEQLRTSFKPIEEGKIWITQDWDAHAYPATETRLPKGIVDNGVNLGQRYFIDQETWTVHFVSLVAKEAK